MTLNEQAMTIAMIKSRAQKAQAKIEIRPSLKDNHYKMLSQ
jgi:hypothetical protein